MKVSRAQAENNRKRVVSVASELFRDRGFDGVGLNEVMGVAGLTRGGFYGQFASKEDLVAQACEYALAVNVEMWARLTDDMSTEDALTGLVDFYLSEAHRDGLHDGCTFAALASEAVRQGTAVRLAFTKGVKSHAAVLAQIAAGHAGRDLKNASLAVLSEMVGAVILARVVEDEELSRGILEAAAADVLERFKAIEAQC